MAHIPSFHSYLIDITFWFWLYTTLSRMLNQFRIIAVLSVGWVIISRCIPKASWILELYTEIIQLTKLSNKQELTFSRRFMHELGTYICFLCVFKFYITYSVQTKMLFFLLIVFNTYVFLIYLAELAYIYSIGLADNTCRFPQVLYYCRRDATNLKWVEVPYNLPIFTHQYI